MNCHNYPSVELVGKTPSVEFCSSSPAVLSESGRFVVLIEALPDVTLSTGFKPFSLGSSVLDDVKSCKPLSGCLWMKCLPKERGEWFKSTLYKCSLWTAKQCKYRLILEINPHSCLEATVINLLLLQATVKEVS